MNNNMQDIKWSGNVIIADADYVDRVAFDLIVNFERMLSRPIPKADLARWIDCVALDGGLRPVSSGTASDSGIPADSSNPAPDNETQVILLHRKDSTAMQNFEPGHYASALNGQAFRDHLGEFLITAVPTDEIVDSTRQFIDTLELVCQQPEVRRIMVIPNADDDTIYNMVRATLRQAQASTMAQSQASTTPQTQANTMPQTQASTAPNTPLADKQVTVFAMQPKPGGPFRQEILGYSLMAALGITGDEINSKSNK